MRAPSVTDMRRILQAAGLDLRASLLQFTRLPLPAGPPPPPGWAARAAWAWPLAGAAVGAAGAAALALAGGLALPALPGAILAVAAMALASGALHEDGLADFADGIGGGRDRDSRLRIMRDSRLGSYGALALLLMTLWRVAVLAALPSAGAIAGVIVVAASARWSAAILAALLPPANPDGQSAAAGRPSLRALGIGLLLCLGLAGLLLPAAAIVLPPLAALGAAATVALIARGRIGGQNGDALGAATQLAEAAGLAALLALAAA